MNQISVAKLYRYKYPLCENEITREFLQQILESQKLLIDYQGNVVCGNHESNYLSNSGIRISQQFIQMVYASPDSPNEQIIIYNFPNIQFTKNNLNMIQ